MAHADGGILFREGGYRELGERVDAFYSFFQLGGRWLSVHRRFRLELPDRALERDGYRSELVLTEYDDSSGGLARVSESGLGAGEDPRVVSDGSCAYVLAKAGLHEDPRNRDFFKLLRLPEGSQTRVRLPEGLAAGKNWQPFLREGRLYAVHGFSPAKILEIDPSGRAGVSEARANDFSIPAPHDSYTIVRGGSNAVVRDGALVGFGHLSTARHEHRPFLWALDARSRMRLTIPAGFCGLRRKGFNIVDPTSLSLIGDELYLGITASERDWFFAQRFLNLLIRVPLNGTDVTAGEFLGELEDFELSDLDCSKTFLPAAMPTQAGAVPYACGVKSAGEGGCLLHGPYEPIDVEGALEAWLSFSCSGASDANRFEVAFHKDGETVAVASQGLGETATGCARVRFSTQGYVGWLLETRVFVDARSDLRVFNIRVTERRPASK